MKNFLTFSAISKSSISGSAAILLALDKAIAFFPARFFLKPGAIVSLLFILFIMPGAVNAQCTSTTSTVGNTTTITYTGTGANHCTFTIPPCASAVTVQCWGGGGGGGGTGRSRSAGGGGGGGAFSKMTNFAHSAGQTYTVIVGTGGTGGAGAVAGGRGRKGLGGETSFLKTSGGTVVCSAAGGSGGGGAATGMSGRKGTGGDAAGSTGFAERGGNGEKGKKSVYGGGGGGGAGTWNPGGNAPGLRNGHAVNGLGAAGGVSGGGNGGNGGYVTADGNDASAAGGGGGGGCGRTAAKSGGDGGAGKVIITYTSGAPAIPVVSVVNSCGNSVLTITNPAPGATFAWSDGGTNNPHTVYAASVLTVTQTVGVCTSGNSNSIIVSPPTAVTASASNTGSYNIGQNIQLNASAGGGTPAYTYSWTGPGGYTATGASATRNNATVAMSGPYNVEITDANGCIATATTNVVVNAPATYTWTGATSTDWTVITNWTPAPLAGGPNGCSDDVMIPFTTNQPVISSPVTIGNITLAQSAQITLNGANISICKNITGGSGAITGTGVVVLNGNSLQTISGSMQVNELQINNSAGVSIAAGSQINVLTALNLQKGNFDATGGSLTFLSTSATQAAIIDNFSPGYTGTISGAISAQRYYEDPSTANSYSQHFMGSPVNTPDFSQFGASGTSGYIIPTANCDESHIASGSPYSTVLAFDETHGATCTSAQWFAEVGGNAQNGAGYAVTRNGGSGVLTLNGTPNLDPSYTLSSLTNSGWAPTTTLQHHTVDAGWHLVSNPYLATLNINTSNPGFDDQIQVWNTIGPFAGSYTQGLVGSDAVVAPFQGFMVHVSTAGTAADYTINASDRIRTPQTFYRANDNELKIIAENTSNNLLDQTVVAFNAAATDQFDPHYDANKSSGNLNRHTLYSVNNGQWMGINTLHDITQTNTVPVGFEPGATATYKFSFNGINTFDPTSYIYLEDKTLNVMHNARSGDYNFAANSTDAWDRFVLHFTPAATMSITDASCTARGTISITQPGTANWNCTITNSSNQNIASGILNQNSPVTVNVATGSYTLALTDINNYTVTKVLQVNGTDQITAAFSASTTVQEGQSVELISTTTNATTYQWDLGNGQTAAGAIVSYNYPEAGTYNVVLTVSNLSGCTSTASQTITVNAATTGISDVTDQGINIWSNENKVYVDFRSLQNVNAVISIYNVIGQQVSYEKFNSNALYQKEIPATEAAYMVVSVSENDKVITKKVFISNGK